MKITPVLVVERIEDCLPFWTRNLGFQKIMDVPHGNVIGFCMLMRDDVEVMMQTRGSVEDDLKTAAGPGRGSASLYIEVDDFHDIRRRLEGAKVVVPERVAFYGMREIGIEEPGGHMLVFAAREPATAA